MRKLDDLSIRIFADGADLLGIAEFAAHPIIRGFTTNPTLMRASGVTSYESFAKDVLALVGDRPVSFEVFSDDPTDMARQARKIASWGDHIFVKIPITDTRGQPMLRLMRDLSSDGIHLNITAVMTLEQVRAVADALASAPASVISVFAGRIADTGRDPIPHLQVAHEIIGHAENVALLWASPREILNIWHANDAGCDIITVTHEMLRKLDAVGRDLDEFSLATVKMFFQDATAAGLEL